MMCVGLDSSVLRFSSVDAATQDDSDGHHRKLEGEEDLEIIR